MPTPTAITHTSPARCITSLGITWSWDTPQAPCRPRKRPSPSTGSWPASTPAATAQASPTRSTGSAIPTPKLGHPADALPATQEAVTIYRELADTDPGRYRPGLADALDWLGIQYSKLGHPADALPPAMEAVAIYRELAGTDPGRYTYWMSPGH